MRSSSSGARPATATAAWPASRRKAPRGLLTRTRPSSTVTRVRSASSRTANSVPSTAASAKGVSTSSGWRRPNSLMMPRSRRTTVRPSLAWPLIVTVLPGASWIVPPPSRTTTARSASPDVRMSPAHRGSPGASARRSGPSTTSTLGSAATTRPTISAQRSAAAAERLAVTRIAIRVRHARACGMRRRPGPVVVLGRTGPAPSPDLFPPWRPLSPQPSVRCDALHTLGVRGVEGHDLLRLRHPLQAEGAERAQRQPVEVGDGLRGRQDAGAELLVELLQPRGEVERLADAGEAEPASLREVAEHHPARGQARPGQVPGEEALLGGEAVEGADELQRRAGCPLPGAAVRPGRLPEADAGVAGEVEDVAAAALDGLVQDRPVAGDEVGEVGLPPGQRLGQPDIVREVGREAGGPAHLARRHPFEAGERPGATDPVAGERRHRPVELLPHQPLPHEEA